jgi:hypothetical protein
MVNVVGNTRLSDIVVFIVVTLSVDADVTEDILHEIAFKNAFVNAPDTVSYIFVAIRLWFPNFRII